MKKEFLAGFGLDDKVISEILAENGKEVSEAQKGADELRAQLDAERERVCSFEAEIGRMRESLGEADVLKNKVEELQKTIDERRAADEAAERSRSMRERFQAAAGGAEFLNDFTRDGLLAEFESALADKANEGKADSEVFDMVISGRENLFAPESGIPSVVAASSGALGTLSVSDVREIMGL